MATTLGPNTSLHYTANGNFVNGVYTPAADGFNLADVGSADMLNYLPTGVKGLVYVGMTDGVTAAFTALVDACKGNPNLYGFYLADEPGASATTAANLMAEADYIHANLPGAKTFMVEQNLSSNTTPNYYYTPANTHIDLFGIDPYPVQTNVPNNLDYNIIPLAVAEAEKVGIPLADLVPVYQAFGGGGYSTYILPTAAQEQQILTTWASAVPTPAFDYTYSWGSQNSDTALSNDPALQAVFAVHNAGGTTATPPAAPTITSPAASSIDTTTATPKISGGGVTGDTVTVSIDGKVAGTATVASSAWSFTPSSPLSNGSHTITATQAAAGGPSSAAASDSFTVNMATAPAAPTITGPAANSIDTTTATPKISGGGVTGDTVTVSIDGKVAGTATVASSAWTFTPSSALGNGSHAITATQAASGGPSSAAASESFTVNMATAPAAPTITGPAANSIDTTTATPKISGGGVTGDTVTVSIDGKVAGTATVASSAWTFTPSSALGNGSHAITATQAASGGPSSAAATESFTVNMATAPAAPTITGPAPNSIDTTTATPKISGGGVTGDTVTVSIDGKVAGTATVVSSAWTFTPSSALGNGSHAITATQAASGGPSSAAASDSFSVNMATAPAAPTITGPAANSIDTTTATPKISGGGVTGDTVTVSIDGKVAGTATVASSAWTFTPSSALGNGSHAITATQAASGGPSSAAAIDSFTVNMATPPAAPTITGPAANSIDTTTATPKISGGGVTGDTVTVSIDGKVAGTATVASSAWSFTPSSPLSNGSHAITATQAAAGGPSSAAASDSFTVNMATPPAAPTLTIADTSLNVDGGGGTVKLGIGVTAPASATDVTVTMTGLRKYETISDGLGDTFHGSSITLTGAQVDSGLTLTSNYIGNRNPVTTLSLMASDTMAGVTSNSATQTMTVTDPGTSSSHHHARELALLSQYMAGDTSGGSRGALQTASAATELDRSSFLLSVLRH